MRLKGTTIMHTLAVLLLLPLSLVFAKDYSDAVQVNKKFLEAMEQYVAKLESAQNGTEVASAFNHYSDTIEELVPEMQALKAKYPELMNAQSQPTELQTVSNRMEELGGRIAGAMMKIIPFMNDPEVRAAQEHMAQVMSQLQ